ncbi:MAG: NAD kinase [Chitinophagia bacterium]|nr:NAD kinase [Chitinophagia bacterium]
MLIAIYNRVFDKEDIPSLLHILRLLEAQNIPLCFFKDFYLRLQPYFEPQRAIILFSGKNDLPRQTDMIISLGGDGTMLDAVCFIGNSGIPLIGINLGRLGFLAAVAEEEVAGAIESLVKGAFSLEQRTLIHLDSSVPLFDGSPFALNEFTIHRQDTSSMIKVHTYLNGEFLNTYWADGLIVATPTVFPQTSSFIITPVAPHNLNTRPIVVPDDNVISFEIEGRSEQFLCTLDARTETIKNTVQLAVKRENFKIALIRPDEHNFLNTMRQKLYWGIDRRN